MLLAPNRLREVKVTYLASPGSRIVRDRVFHLSLEIGQQIFEPLKLLKGVGKVTLEFDRFIPPNYARELVQAMTAPKDAPVVAENIGTATDLGVDENLGEQPDSSNQHGGREDGTDLGPAETEGEKAEPSTKKGEGGERRRRWCYPFLLRVKALQLNLF